MRIEDIECISPIGYIVLTNNIIYKVPFLKHIFTHKNKCNVCGAKIINIKCKHCIISVDNIFYFLFDNYCDCCGAKYFKYNTKLYYVIDDKLINDRKRKINKLLKIKK